MCNAQQRARGGTRHPVRHHGRDERLPYGTSRSSCLLLLVIYSYMFVCRSDRPVMLLQHPRLAGKKDAWMQVRTSLNVLLEVLGIKRKLGRRADTIMFLMQRDYEIRSDGSSARLTLGLLALGPLALGPRGFAPHGIYLPVGLLLFNPTTHE